MGSMSFESFTDNPFFRPIDFEALERKEIEPIFVPSSDKTNFDATYDLEELLLEEAPLEARARRQKPREALKEDATDKEIREDELYKMIETQFTTFDYTKAAYVSMHPLTFLLTLVFANMLLDSQDMPVWIPRMLRRLHKTGSSRRTGLFHSMAYHHHRPSLKIPLQGR